ncbi:MAG: hypothetical protein JSV30_07015 [Candidatus Omnitrophota bacterium]|nr:MAG: hypothetical protein JSV30_07015 [Candidatus Omnitrophota bacterium]
MEVDLEPSASPKGELKLMDNKFGSLILVKDRSQLNEAFKLHEELSQVGKNPLILTAYGKEIIDKKYSVRDLDYYQKVSKLTYSYIEQERYNLFYSLADQKLNEHMSLNSLITYEGVSLWQLSAQYIFSELGIILYNINIMEAILDFEKPKEVHIINDSSNLEKIVRLLCQKRKIPSFLHRKTRYRILSLNKASGRSLIFFRKIKRTLLSAYFLFINLKKSIRFKNREYKIIFFTHLERFFDSMLPVALKYNDNERLVINTYQSGCSKKMNKNRLSFMDFYGYSLYNPFAVKTKNFLKKTRSAILNNSSFFSKILYKGLPLGSLLTDMFEKTIYEIFPEKIREIDITRKIILSHRPKVIVVNHSFELILIAKSLSITIVAIQAGHPDEFILYGPVDVDAITVEGNYWKEYLLSKKAIAPDKLWVAGLPKFDFKRYDDLALMRDKSKKIVVFASDYATAALGMLESERIAQIYALCNAMKNIKDAHLIIKLHPYEKDSNTYRKIARETGLSSFTIVRNIDTLKLLNICDLLITHFSHVAYTAVLMGKNVIVSSYSSDFFPADSWDFKRYGVVIAVNDLKELENHIRNALFDSEIKSRLKINSERYIFDHAYKIDGKATKRVKDVIDQFI